jgi:penicillin amidase
MNIPRLLFRLLLGRRLPITSGTITVPGAKRPVVIRRDRYGIPYIEAEGEEDAWYGVGFCQGQDRAFELETLLRVARGTLAELVGPGGIGIDRLSRRIGFLHSARRQLEFLDPSTRDVLEAFAHGVTEGSRLGCRRVAHEFTLLRTRPTPYAALDVVAASILQAFALSSNWDIELARLHMLNEDGPEALAALDPAYPDWLPVSVPPGVPAGPAMDRLSEDMKSLVETAGLTGGSNGWAIAPSRTATGRAILANDPHLPPTLPSRWYLAHVRTPEWTAAGATFIGFPVFPIGHNEVAAWGITLGLADNTDLFIEELGPDGRSVREGDRFVPCEVRREVIRVKGGPDVVEEVVVTTRGPVVGPALGGGAGVLSLLAKWLEPRPLKGLMNVHRARSFEELRLAFAEWSLMSLNVLYADTTGTIGWLLAGELPQRRKGWGTIPLPGWDPDSGWSDDPVPFDEMPQVVDPPSGVVASANNQPALDGEGPFLGIDWLDGYRQARILEALEARGNWDLASVQALQMDQESMPWRELHDLVLATPAKSAEAREALDLLRGWGGRVTADSPSAAVFELFLSEMSRIVVEAKAPRSSKWALGRGPGPILPYTLLVARRVGHLVRLLRDQPAGWFERPWADVAEGALAAAVKTLRQKYGDDHRSWAWGDIRTLTLRHPLGERRILRRLFNLGPFPWGGDANTVAQAAPDPADPTANPLVIASLRMVVDVGNWEECRFSLPSGQSGNPLSPHYDDLLTMWKRGEGVPIAWSPAEVERAAESTLSLLSASASS